MIRIITDSSSDLPAQVAEQYGVDVVPLTIRFGDEEFVDRSTLTAAGFWDRLVTADQLPETAAPSAGLFEERYRTMANEGASGIVVITISSHLSATYQSAVIAAERLSGDIRIKVMDSRSVGMGLGLPVLEAAGYAAEGAGFDDVATRAAGAARSTKVIAALDTLEYLKRGGRIGNTQAFFGSLLNIKPLITLEDGVVSPFGRVRTRTKAIAALEERVAALGPRIRAAALFHGAAPDIESITARIEPHLNSRLIVTLLGAVVGTHTGPGTVGIAYLTG
ncbi:MAG: DegV family protein [Acidimicrobiia bacterium]|nr:DegV family protein [Acidimicrobiia bacterium]